MKFDAGREVAMLRAWLTCSWAWRSRTGKKSVIPSRFQEAGSNAWKEATQVARILGGEEIEFIRAIKVGAGSQKSLRTSKLDDLWFGWRQRSTLRASACTDGPFRDRISCGIGSHTTSLGSQRSRL